MQYVGRFVSSVYNTITPNINPSTLSGAIDVIVVERSVERQVTDENGETKTEWHTELASTPFHVRFGKMSVLRPAERKVTLHLNDQPEPLPFAMKVGDAGEAFFVEELDDEARQGMPDDLVTSPILSASSSPYMAGQDDEVDFRPQPPSGLHHLPERSASDAHLDLTRRHDAPRKLITEDYVEPFDLGASLSRSSLAFAEQEGGEEDEAQEQEQLTRAQEALSKLDLEQKDRLHEHLDIEQDLFTRPDLESTNSAPMLPIDGQALRRGSLGNSESHINDAHLDPFDLATQPARATTMHESESSDAGTVKSGETRISDETGATSPSLHATSDNEKPEAKRAATVPFAANAKDTRPRKTYAKTLRLTSDQLKSLNLRKGANSITFSVTSSYSGVATCAARIFLWESAWQVVVSDIDGTITKSDALGHVYTMIGRDWTHSGVAKLYTDIVRNGYKIMYLTSRAIGQADTTRDYLRGIKQGSFRMPDGPVIMSPDRLMASLHREVILRKPEVFKMGCLRDIARLFGADPRTAPVQPGNSLPVQLKDAIQTNDTPAEPSEASSSLQASSSGQAKPTPFYAGFGNRITDALSYRSVNIPSSRIFTIDHNSEVKMELLELAGYTSSYIHMTDLVDQMFPPITALAEKGHAAKPEFNDFNFWRSNLGEFELPDDDELIHTPLASSPVSPALSARSVRSTASLRSSASTTVLHRASTQKKTSADDGGDKGSVKTMPINTPTDEGASSASRLSRFSLSKLGLSRRGSAQTIAAPPISSSSAQADAQGAPSQQGPMAHSPYNIASSIGTSPPSSPGSSYGNGVTSWTAGWRRRTTSPDGGVQSGGSSVHATSPLVGPVITAEPDEDDFEGGEDDDDVSSIGEDDYDDDDEQDGDRLGSHSARRQSASNVEESRRQYEQRHRRTRTMDNMGDNVLDDDDDDDGLQQQDGDQEEDDEAGVDDLLETGEIRFDWRK